MQLSENHALTMLEFLRVVGELKLRGTSMIFRAPMSFHKVVKDIKLVRIRRCVFVRLMLRLVRGRLVEKVHFLTNLLVSVTSQKVEDNFLFCRTLEVKKGPQLRTGDTQCQDPEEWHRDQHQPVLEH